MKISVISPIYNAENIVEELSLRLAEAIEPITSHYEIILVEDGSPDNSWGKIESICAAKSNVIGVKLSRNFGQHYAITAGIFESTGDYVVVIDCDLQDDPKYIADLVKKAEEGFDIVYTTKQERKHSLWKNITASIFNTVFNWLIDNNKQLSASKGVGSFSLMTRQVVDAYKSMGDYKRHYLMILRFLGFPSSSIEIEHKDRYEGESSYTFRKLVSHALDGIVAQSNKLLRITIVLGFFISLVAVLSGLFIVIQALINNFAPGWASTIVVVLFIGGLTISSVGVAAIYIGNIYEQVKQRPLYFIEKKLNR